MNAESTHKRGHRREQDVPALSTPMEQVGSPTLSRAELRVADAIGSIIELWGFRRQLGRIWAVLFLSERPLAAPELCERLQISTGLLSMSLTELRRWEVVRSVTVSGDRKEHFEAETHVWKMVRKVLAEREQTAVEEALRTFERALVDVRAGLAHVDPLLKLKARFRVRRLEQLAGLARAGLGILSVLLDTARVDVGPLQVFSEVLGRRRP
jgi:DNA-binding transcriptional regulator GbsR (MarR family)